MSQLTSLPDYAIYNAFRFFVSQGHYAAAGTISNVINRLGGYGKKVTIWAPTGGQ